jgi:2-dehydropantoate 2-reductase
MVTQTPPILVVGTGAMASLFAARFSANGLRVRMLGTWVESITALNMYGVRFIDENGQEYLYPVEATDDPEKCFGSQFAIILVKSYQTQQVALRLAQCLADDGLALTLQNGLDNHKILARVLGEQRVASGVTTAGATLIAPGIVRMGGKGAISLGHHIRLRSFIDLLVKAGFDVETVEDTDSLLWGKLMINASINPLTALLKIPNGDLLSIPPARRMMNLVTIETANVASSAEISLPFSDPVAAVESVAQRTASNYSSMYIDVTRGSQTEIDAINGAIVRVGENTGASVEYNRMFWLMVKAMTIKSAT